MIQEIDIVSVKLVKEGKYQYAGNSTVNSPDSSVKILQQFIGDRDREYMAAILLDTKLQANAITVISIGSLNSAIIHPREVFKAAILHNAASIIIAHNHPSGNTTPSSEDIAITDRLSEASKIMGIELLDHIIVTESKYYSFREEGRL